MKKKSCGHDGRQDWSTFMTQPLAYRAVLLCRCRKLVQAPWASVGLLGWSCSSLIPGWANVSQQAHWACQCHFAASILVSECRGVSGCSVWVGVKKKTEEPVTNSWWSPHFPSHEMHLKWEEFTMSKVLLFDEWNPQTDTKTMSLVSCKKAQ